MNPPEKTNFHTEGQRITDEINADPEEVAKLRESIRQADAGEWRYFDDDGRGRVKAGMWFDRRQLFHWFLRGGLKVLARTDGTWCEIESKDV